MLADALTVQGDYEGATALFSFLLARGSREDIRERAREGLGRVAQRRLSAAARAGSAAAGGAPGAPPELPAPPPVERPTTTRFRRILRELGAGEQRVLGVFRTIECRQGTVILEVQTPTALVRLAAGDWSDIDFISYRMMRQRR